jgi:hypothetical protein
VGHRVASSIRTALFADRRGDLLLPQFSGAAVHEALASLKRFRKAEEARRDHAVRSAAFPAKKSACSLDTAARVAIKS